MSSENLAEEAKKARENYSIREKQRSQILKEVGSIIMTRRNNRRWPEISRIRLNQELRSSRILVNVRAAVFFWDKDKFLSEVICGRDISDTQVDICRANSELTSETKMPGEIITLIDETRYFLCSPIIIRQDFTQPITRGNRLREIADALLNHGYIPVDAEFRILPINC